MRSTVFIVFGAAFILMLVLIIFSNISTNNDPVIRVARQFFAAVAAQDAAACERTLDSSAAKLIRVENKITSIDFSAMHGQGALASYPGTVWNFVDLSGVTLDQSTPPDIADEAGLATVFLSQDLKMYLRRIGKGDNWKIIYISAVTTAKR